MMRIFSVTPIDVSQAELHRRQQRYARLSPAGLTVHLDNIGPQGPAQLASEEDVAASEHAVSAALDRAGGDGWDALIPDCVLDPGVMSDGASTEPPVFGMLGMMLQHFEGRRIGAIARNHTIAAQLHNRIAEWGYEDALTEVSVLDLDVGAIADPKRWNEEMETAVDRLASVGSTVVINGCSAVDVVNDYSVDVVDPMSLALKLLAPG